MTREDELYQKFSRNFAEDTVDDLVLLPDPNEYVICDILKNRSKQQEIYTYIGNTVVSVNPYKKLPLYDNEVKHFYHSKQPYELTAHLFSLAEDAFRSMRETSKSQSIIVSGESGSGKTEASKIILDYLANVSISGLVTDNIKRIVLASNVVLEAFGNAKTLRNDNSSRFGKYIDLFFNFKGQLEGAQITTSLLEKSRVTKQRKGERNYHIFYQLCAGADDVVRKQLGLSKAKDFEYLNQNEIEVKSINDKQEFKNTQFAMVEAGISLTEQMEIFRIVAGVLHLGNIRFKALMVNNAEGSDVENVDVLKKAATCLQIDDQDLKNAIVFRSMKVGREVTKIPQNPTKASYNRDALAKGIYDRLFTWLIRRINSAVKKPDNARMSIGVLDIYGFEIYEQAPEVNSLEQLNINHVNERIQFQVQKWLENEQNEYVSEGVPWRTAKLYDCSPCLEVIEGDPYGVYKYLDEESLLAQGTDANYVRKVNEYFGKDPEKWPAFEKSRFGDLTFGLKHFAAQVKYDTKDWVEKNRDTLFEDMILSMRSSNLELMKQLFPRDEKIAAAGKLQTTTVRQFSEDVNGLVGKLSGKGHHFIKCIKPNHSKKPDSFLDDLVIDQIRYLGLTGNVSIRKAGFYFKMPYEQFLARYKLCSDKTWPKWEGTARAGCETILKDMKLQGKYALGKTMVFLQTPVQLFALDEKIQSRRKDMASLIQKSYRTFKTKQQFIQNQHLVRALERTYGEHGPFSFNQAVSILDEKGIRKRCNLLVAPKALYVLEPKSFAVLRRIPFDKITRIFTSSLPDEIFAVTVDKAHDLLVESDSKNEAMKAVRDAVNNMYKENSGGHPAIASQQLPVDIGEEFQYFPRRGLSKTIKYLKNPDVKSTTIEPTPEGLVVYVRPADDVFDGQKMRRKKSFHKKFYGDYIHLQNSELMKQITKDYGDQHVCFSGVAVKYNKKYKRQERVIMITERAMYNLDPNGYMINRRIPLRRVKGVSVSPLTDNFFILHIPDEYDYVLECTKKTEVLKVLSENYTAATRSALKYDVSEEVRYKADKDGNEKVITFREDKKAKETVLVPSKTGAEVKVRPEEVITSEMDLQVVQDIYQGQKLRRRESLLKYYMGDYLFLTDSKLMQKIQKKFGDTKLLYSSVVTKVNKRYMVQDRKLVITDQALYNLDKDGSGFKRRIAFKDITGIACSSLKDGFFVLRVPGEYDYLYTSPNKTEIIKCIIDQYKRLYNKQLELNVDDKIVYNPDGMEKPIRTIDFRDDPEVQQPTILPTGTGILVKINNNEDDIDLSGTNRDPVGIKDTATSVYAGRKYRRKDSMEREYMGDYLRIKESPKLKNLFKQFGDNELLFSSELTKINKKFKDQNRVLLISDKAVYNVDPQSFKVKRRIPLDDIDGASVSSMPDGHFCLHVPSSYDYLFSSDKKTEIIDVLAHAASKRQKDVKINVADKFEFRPSHNELTSVSFVLDEQSQSGFLEPTNQGLVIHVQHDEPAVVLEAAFVHVKDQPKPIEIKPDPILIKLRKRWRYKIEIRFYVNQHLQNCSFHETIDNVIGRQEFVSQVADLEPREERYVITLPERRVIYSLLSKTRVKCKMVDPLGNILLAVRFVYDVR